jgi:MFS family permease
MVRADYRSDLYHHAVVTTELKHTRFAISTVFAVNGFLVATWLPRLFEVQQGLGMSDGQLGAALSAGAIGGVLCGPLAAPLVARWGSARVIVVQALLLAIATPLVGFAPSWLFFAGVLAWIGATDAIMDAAMNAHGIRVQLLYRRSILNGLHGFWSLGTVIGGILGTATLALSIPLGPFLIGVAALSVFAIVFTARWLLPAPDPHSHDTSGVIHARKTWSWLLIGLGVFTLLAVVVEDVPARWSSIYLASLTTSSLLIGSGFVAFTFAMTIGRFTGDRLVDRFGNVRVIRVSMSAAAVGMGGALLIGTPWAYIVASLVVGYSIATLFPAAMRAAAHIPGIRPATGVAIASWLARAGFVFSPIIVGLVADSAGIAWGLTLPVFAALLLVALASVVGDHRSE